MKRLLALILALLLSLTLAAPALADFAFEPDNRFYMKHATEFSYVERNYFTNGPDGYVLIYDDPTARAISAVPNGERLWVYWAWDDGKWVYVDGEHCIGWMRMADLILDYDSDAFIDDHEAELVEAERSLHTRREDGDALYCYTYPGSGKVKYRLSWDFYVPGETSYSLLFTDPAGRTWGYQGYYQGRNKYWVCLDDPCNGELPADENFVDPLATLTPRADTATIVAAARAARTPSPWLLAGAGGVIVIAAAICAAAVKRKKKNL